MKTPAILFAIFLSILTYPSNTSAQAEKGNRNDKSPQNQDKQKKENKAMKSAKSEDEWKKILTPMEYNVLREKGTERPFTGEYWDKFEKGQYKCAGCGEVLFESKTKFDAGCGWPSFYEAVDKSKIIEKDDYSHGMHRVEVMCASCGGHLGHVFPDGPKPTGMRYCINSVSIKFEKK